MPLPWNVKLELVTPETIVLSLDSFFIELSETMLREVRYGEASEVLKLTQIPIWTPKKLVNQREEVFSHFPLADVVLVCDMNAVGYGSQKNISKLNAL